MISGGTLIEYRLFLKIKWRYYHMTLKWFCMRDKMERFSSTSLLNVIIFLPKFVQCFKFCIVFLVIILTFNMYCLHVFKFLIILIWMQKYRSKTQTIITKMLFKQPITFSFYFFSLISILYLLFFRFEFGMTKLVSIATSWATRISSLNFVEIEVQGTVLISCHFSIACADLPSNTHTMWQFEKDAGFWSCIVNWLLVVSAPSSMH